MTNADEGNAMTGSLMDDVKSELACIGELSHSRSSKPATSYPGRSVVYLIDRVVTITLLSHDVAKHPDNHVGQAILERWQSLCNSSKAGFKRTMLGDLSRGMKLDKAIVAKNTPTASSGTRDLHQRHSHTQSLMKAEPKLPHEPTPHTYQVTIDVGSRSRSA
ncbi:MAG: hypothetical protein Q9159_004677 [Coniocarpon cinnabarinum]